MTAARTFERQVRPVRAHLTLDHNHFLCGYVQRYADPPPDTGQVPLCGPCFVAFHLLHREMERVIQLTQPPDLDLTTSVALLRETEWGPRSAHLDLDAWARQNEVVWAKKWRPEPAP